MMKEISGNICTKSPAAHWMNRSTGILEKELAMSVKTVVLNGDRMNYDHRLDFSILSDEVKVYEETETAQILERVQGFDIVVTKEIPVPGDIIRSFPDCVKLIVEAGTGYNNHDLEAIKEKGITLCNVPAYSTERVAHTAIMMILNLSSSMRKQMNMLHDKDRSNFTRYMQVDHVEINGKEQVLFIGLSDRKRLMASVRLDKE